jgi:hypothetical protein
MPEHLPSDRFVLRDEPIANDDREQQQRQCATRKPQALSGSGCSQGTEELEFHRFDAVISAVEARGVIIRFVGWMLRPISSGGCRSDTIRMALGGKDEEK